MTNFLNDTYYGNTWKVNIYNLGKLISTKITQDHSRSTKINQDQTILTKITKSNQDQPNELPGHGLNLSVLVCIFTPNSWHSCHLFMHFLGTTFTSWFQIAQKYEHFHWIGPLGRFSHRVAMSLCVSVCMYVCMSPLAYYRLNVFLTPFTKVLSN